jgi:hypothetical protein
VGFVVEALHRRLVNREVHPLDLAVGPRLVGLGQPVLDSVGFADHVEARWTGIDGVAVPGPLGKLDAIVNQYGVDPIRHGFEYVLRELATSFPVSGCNELSDNEFACPV